MRIVYLCFSLSIIDGVVIVAILIISFKKTDKESNHFSRLSHKENDRRVSSPSKTIVLNEVDFENDQSYLLDQSTLSTLTHELNLDPYSNIESIR